MSFHEDSFHQRKNNKFKMSEDEMYELAWILEEAYNSGNISTLFSKDDMQSLKQFILWHDGEINVSP